MCSCVSRSILFRVPSPASANQDPAWTQQPVLTGRFVTLEPMTMAHVEEVFNATPKDTFDFFPMRPPSWDAAGFVSLIGDALADRARWTFVITSHATDTGKPRVIGSSSLLDMRPAHKGVEVGATWYSHNARGTRINPECKLLLLQHCFDMMQCQRVQLKCDARNEVSKRAIAKMGATYEGTLRKHMMMPDGYQRDTVMFSVIREEWPRVRDLLRARINGPSSYL